MAEAQQTSSIDALTARAVQLLQDSQPADAAQILKGLVQRIDTERPEDTGARANERRLLGSALRESGDLAGSTSALEGAIRLLQQTDSPDGWLLANSLRSVAMNYDAIGHADKAQTARLQSLDIAASQLANDPGGTLTIFFAISEEMHRAQREDWQMPLTTLMQKVAALDVVPALPALVKINEYGRNMRNLDLAQSSAVEAAKRVRGLDDPALLSNFGAVHNLAYGALYSRSTDAAREMIARLAAVLDHTNTERVYVVRRLEALFAHESDDDSQAVDLARTVYTLAQTTFGDDDSRTRISQRELAEALEAAKNTDEAITTYRGVLEREERVGKDPVTTAEIAASLAHVLDDASRYKEAAAARWTEFGVRRQAQGETHPATNRTRYELAELSRVLGRVEEAEFFYRQVLLIDDKNPDPDPEFGLRARNNLGELYVVVGKYNLARGLFEQALASRRKSGEDSERAWRSRMSLAELANRSGDANQSVSLARAAIARDEFSGNPAWHVILAIGLLQQGQHTEAEDLFRRLYQSMPIDRVGGAVSFESYFDIVAGLAACRLAREDWPGAVETVTGVVPIIRERLLSVIRDSSEVQLTKFAGQILGLQSLWLLALSHVSPTPEQLTAAFELVQLTKGLRTRYLRWRHPGSNVDSMSLTADDGSRKLLDDLQRAQDDLTTALLMRETIDDGADEPIELVLKRAKVRRCERLLAGGIGDGEVAVDRSLSSPMNLLPDGAIALELLVVRDVLAERRGDTPAHHYMAFVVSAGTDAHSLRLVDLGLCDEIDTAITGMRDSLASDPWIEDKRPPAWHRLSRFLGKAILKPVWDEIAAPTTQHLLVAPDGLMGALPFEILTTPDDTYLLDKVKVSYVMRFSELGRDREVFTTGSAPIVMAGPNFDLPDAFVGARGSAHGVERLFARAFGGLTRFDDLSKARDEGTDVAALLGVEAMTGVWALGPELLQSQSPEIIHLSTHGFSVPYERADTPASLAAPLGNAIDRRIVLEDPMQRSGLAMSGANRALDERALPPEAGAGIIYAADLQQLDLQRTDMVVLSACRSGLGDMSIGDGAHGLRRAFLAAGARSVVSTLWDVPEGSSQKLVAIFYQRLLEKAPRFEALADARKAVRRDHPNDPVHWAGFVLDGSFGPLYRFTPLGDLRIAQITFSNAGLDALERVDADTRRAQRLVGGPNPRPELLKSAIVLKRAAVRTDLSERDRIFVLFKLADLSNRLGENDSAVALYRQALGVKSLSDDNRVDATYNLAKMLNQMKRFDESVIAHTELLTLPLDPRFKARAHINRGNAYLGLGRIGDAVTDFTAVIDDTEAPPDQTLLAHMNRSAVLSDIEPALALQDAEEALKSDQADIGETLKLRIQRADLWIKTGKSQPALDDIAQLEQTPNLSDEIRGMLTDLRARATG